MHDQGSLPPLYVSFGKTLVPVVPEGTTDVAAFEACHRRGATYAFVGSTSSGIGVQYGARPEFDGKMIPLGTRCWLLDVAREHVKEQDTNVVAACEDGRYMEAYRLGPTSPWVAQGWWPELAETYGGLQAQRAANSAR